MPVVLFMCARKPVSLVTSMAGEQYYHSVLGFVLLLLADPVCQDESTDCLGILFTEKKEYVTYGGADQGWAFTSGYLAGEKLAETILAE